MKPLCLLLLLLGGSAAAQTPTVDFPKGSDWSTVTRPTNSIIAAVSHTDFDEFLIPLSASVGAKFAKTLPVKGAVDYLAYSGPASQSTFQNLDLITKQMLAEGFRPVFNCVRAACGGVDMASSLSMPLINTLDGTSYHNFTVEAFGAATGDVRYTVFQRDAEYMMVLTTLNPGQFSGVLLIDVGGKNFVPQTAVAPPSGATPAEARANPNPPAPTAKQRIRSKLGSLLNPN